MKRNMILLHLFFVMQIAQAMQVGIENKRIGEIIYVQTNEQIAAWCNFNTQIVKTASGVLCVYNGRATDPTIASE